MHGDGQPSNVLVDEAGQPLVIDWQYAHVGDPREDLGDYTQIPTAPNVYWADPEHFRSRYCERTGLTEEQVNPAVVEYFLIIGMANLLGPVAGRRRGSRSDDPPGIMAAYMVNAISHQYDMFLSICDRLG